MLSPQSIKRQLLKYLKSSNLQFYYDKQNGVIEIASMALSFNCQLGYVIAHVRVHSSYCGSIHLPYYASQSFLDRLISIYQRWCEFNCNLIRIKYYKSNNKIVKKQNIAVSEIEYIRKRLSHVFRA